MPHTTDLTIEDSAGNKATVWSYLTAGRNMGGAVLVVGFRSALHQQTASELPKSTWIRNAAKSIDGLTVKNVTYRLDEDRIHVLLKPGSKPEARDALIGKIARKMLKDFKSV